MLVLSLFPHVLSFLAVVPRSLAPADSFFDPFARVCAQEKRPAATAVVRSAPASVAGVVVTTATLTHTVEVNVAVS